MSLLISRGDLLTLRSHDLRSLKALQKSGVLYYHLISESLDILQLILLLCNPLLFSLFLDFGLCLSPGFLSYTLYMTGLSCSLQMKEGLLLLFMLLLHFTVLLFKHFSVILRNIRGSRGRHNDTEIRAKNFFFHLCIVNLSTITEFLDKLNRTLKAQS